VTKLLQNRGATISFTVTDQFGVPADAAAPPLVTVRDGAGAIVAGPSAATDVGTGVYDFGLTPAQTAVLDIYTATWVYVRAGNAETATSRFEVVGAFYFTVAEARAFDNAALASETSYPNAKIAAGRDLVEDELEVACGVAFVPRARRVSLPGAGRAELVLPDRRVRSLLSGSVGGTALTDPELAAITLRPEGVAYRQSGWPSSASAPFNVWLHYAVGYDAPPERIKRAALVLLRHRLVASNIEDRAISYTDEFGTRALAVAGRRGQPFGIPDVDAAVQDYDERLPAIG
jgi:hypothetical protein